MMLLEALVDTRRWTVRNDIHLVKPGDMFMFGGIKVRVENIHATGKFLKELPGGWTALVTFSGDGVEHLKTGMILNQL